ncbi:MAG: alpha/beta hydrolase [Erysipelotrichaceae bacterium]|nr:alpha/beta hydrolase [Erysipelotrichaceae bacterium]
MEKISRNTTLYELSHMEEFSQVGDRWITGWEKQFREKKSLSVLGQEHPEWNPDDIVYGIRNLQRVAEHYEQFIYHPSKNEKVCLFHVPAEKRTSNNWFLLCAGGGYGAVCTMVESLPAAARLNELGYDCFCLNYTTASPGSFLTGLMPEPLDDLADSFRYIEREFNLKAENCFLTGFSAGGHLAACYGLSEIGARKYGLANPKGLLLVYPLISLKSIDDRKMKNILTLGLFGILHRNKTASQYEIHEHIDSYYPKTFYISCRDDRTIPADNPSLMKQALDRKGILNCFELHEKGGHGFGLGSIDPGSDYMDRAVSFLEEKE